MNTPNFLNRKQTAAAQPSNKVPSNPEERVEMARIISGGALAVGIVAACGIIAGKVVDSGRVVAKILG
jgi:hypothetical protein